MKELVQHVFDGARTSVFVLVGLITFGRVHDLKSNPKHHYILRITVKDKDNGAPDSDAHTPIIISWLINTVGKTIRLYRRLRHGPNL